MSDEFYTPTQSWEKVSKYLPDEPVVVYEPFFGKGHTYNFLKNEGYLVLGQDGIDFYSDDATNMLKQCDCVITNPPFSIKYDVIQRLVQYDVPFMIIFPMGCITTNKFCQAFNNDTSNVSVIIPKGRLKFIKNEKIVSPNFDSCYVSYKMVKEKLVFLAEQ